MTHEDLGRLTHLRTVYSVKGSILENSDVTNSHFNGHFPSFLVYNAVFPNREFGRRTNNT
jgi:hypothetical protein